MAVRARPSTHDTKQEVVAQVGGVEIVRREVDDPLRERDLVTFLAKLVEERRRSGRR